ncbi:DNA modification methylase [Alisedimentitalea sp. MJ-SS2]|uniref:DNA modification methylase n=1 Tax=Aliisedimentitalea sp. MJ-SS2 TaxID=3049795 RepID=UPI00290E76F4|nr:DNA modification methylase [Alisedimentitalea sp. MJ-SS2]MDU8926267.1 DNA modification methylase [Alisedimentitalea sp. MJ-SS2]
MTEVPCLRLDYMSEDEKRAYVLADNKLALNVGWDEDLLAAELGALMSADLEFDVSVTGFSIPEIDGLMDAVAPEDPGDPEDDVVPDLALARVQPGGIWQLGRHRLVCGDALDADVIVALMEDAEARMVFSDPPYNVAIDGHVGNSGKIQHREFTMASGEMSRQEFTTFLGTAFRNLADHSTDGSIHFICMGWWHMSEMLAAGQGVYDGMKNLNVWAKDNSGMGTFYRSRRELTFVFRKGRAPHLNNFELGQLGRYRTNVWEYRGASSRHGNRMEELALHPTVKPVQMIAGAIRDVSARGDIVLGIFGGSGSTLIAAEKTGRRGYLCELDPIYCDRILARWESFAKDEAEQLVCCWPQEVQVQEAEK